MLPSFPQEKPLEISDREEIESYTKTFAPFSDFNFVSLYTYNTHEHIRVSLLHNNLVIKFQDYTDIDPQQFYSFIGNKLPLETVEILLSHQKNHQMIPMLKLIPSENFLDNPLPDNIIFEEDRDQFDYIFSTSGILDVSKAKFSHKRRLIKRFQRENPTINILYGMDGSSKKVQDNIMDCITNWGTLRHMDASEIHHEMIALERLLSKIEELAVEIIGIEKDNQLLAFSVYNKVSDTYGIIHFAKYNPTYRGIFETLVMKTLEALHKKGCNFANVEQDLGVEGMRTAKMLWYPDHFLKKYKIFLKD